MVLRLVSGGSGSKKKSIANYIHNTTSGAAPSTPMVTAPPPVARPVPANPAPPTPVWGTDDGYDGGGSSGGGGGGGGGGGAAVAATAAAARPSLQDYISGNYLYKQAGDESTRRLGEFDADTGRQRGLVQADQALRRNQLKQTLDDQGESNAETMAGRGLLRSGLTFQNQDKINQFGNQQNSVIDQLLGTFAANRASQRSQQEAANRQSISDAIAKITDQYTNQFGV